MTKPWLNSWFEVQLHSQSFRNSLTGRSLEMLLMSQEIAFTVYACSSLKEHVTKCDMMLINLECVLISTETGTLLH